jgi:hypothetical protein
MKRSVGLIAFLVLILSVLSASKNEIKPQRAPKNEWTWVSGSSSYPNTAAYGMKGKASRTYVPGPRKEAVSWVDAQGCFWLFGGMGINWARQGFYLNDLWKFDPATLEWTWFSGSIPKGPPFVFSEGEKGVYGTKGTPAAPNVPGSRYGATSWVDANGNLWLFGGWGYDSTSGFASLNDLWKFDTTTLEWSWISGSKIRAQVGIYGTKGIPSPLNVPGSRIGAVSWVDASGNFWLFGGDGLASIDLGNLNDLWKFNPVTLEWTWISGSNRSDHAGSYGKKGIADPANAPGARKDAVAWFETSGKLWLFGGHVSGPKWHRNDLWKFDLLTLNWTWVSGSNSIGEKGIYGTKGTPNRSIMPGGRSAAVSWTDSNGNLWLFGGSGYDSTGQNTVLNDLWKYDPSTSEWTWVSGSNLGFQRGVYGTIGVAEASNVPSGRYDAVSWMDSNGSLWLFGGYGVGGFSNDLWKFSR